MQNWWYFTEDQRERHGGELVMLHQSCEASKVVAVNNNISYGLPISSKLVYLEA